MCVCMYEGGSLLYQSEIAAVLGREKPQLSLTCEDVLGVTGEGAVPHPLLCAPLQRIPQTEVSSRPNLTGPIS